MANLRTSDVEGLIRLQVKLNLKILLGLHQAIIINIVLFTGFHLICSAIKFQGSFYLKLFNPQLFIEIESLQNVSIIYFLDP